MRTLDLYLDDDFTGAIAALGPVMAQIDYKEVLFPTAAYHFNIAFQDIPQATITWTAQEGRLLVLAHMIIRPSGVQSSSTMVRAKLGAAILGYPTHVDSIVANRNKTLHLIATSLITAGNQTLHLEAEAADDPMIYLDPGFGNLIIIVFPTAMIAP